MIGWVILGAVVLIIFILIVQRIGFRSSKFRRQLFGIKKLSESSLPSRFIGSVNNEGTIRIRMEYSSSSVDNRLSNLWYYLEI